MPTVSVIIATYNHADYLAAAVESVFAQQFQDWELLIVDDGSTDRTPEVLAELAAAHPGRLRFVRQTNAGVGAAMNRGLAETAAPLVAFLDSDDTWAPTHLATLVGMLQPSPSPWHGEGRGEGAGWDQFATGVQSPPTQSAIRNPKSEIAPVLAFGRRDSMDAAGHIFDKPGKLWFTGRVTAELFRSMFISKICIVVRREAIERAGLFDTALRMGEDYELMLRLSRLGTFLGTEEVVAHRRRHGSNLTADTPAFRVRTAALLERFYFKLDGRRDVAPDIARKRLGHLHYAAGKKLLRAGDGAAARFHLGRAAAFDLTVKVVALRPLAMMSAIFARQSVSPQLPQGYEFIPTAEAVDMLGSS